MAEATVPAFEAMPDEVRNRKFNNLFTKVTSQEVGGLSFSEMYNALQEAEVGAYKERKGYPYIFTAGSKKSSAFGPMQITYSTALDYFYDGANETEQRENMKAGNFKEGYTQLPPEVKTYIKSFIEQGINKRNNKGGVFGSLGVGNISKEDHEKYYPFLAGVHFTEKKKLAADDSRESFVKAHFGDIREDDPKKDDKERQLANLQTKVYDAIDVEAKPVTTGLPEGFEPVPTKRASPGGVNKGADPQREYFIDDEGPLPDIGEEIPMPEIADTDVAPETTDAIPVIDVEPEQPNLFERIGESISGFFSSDESDAEGEQMRQDMLSDLESSYGTPQMNKGGMPVEKQMDMFDDGGLMDEGGTVDEQSGNDVPPGSLKEEVRDDIPAQLSEGEFVFPADVVRYIGLEKLMQMRQEAKAGLARMEDMGQMGNSEEAVLPDDIPFTLDDIEMDDDTMEFQTGGLVPNQFGVYQQASQFGPQFGINPPPTYQPPTAPVTQPVQQPLQTGFTPVTTPAAPTTDGTVPSFEQLMPTTTGRYDELKEYINKETGQTMTIPFVDGKPIYPIPEGFTEVETDVVEEVAPTTPQQRVETARVVEDSDDDDRGGPQYSTTDVTGIGYDKNKLTKELRDVVSEFGAGFGTLGETFNVGSAIAREFSKDPRVKDSSLTSAALGGVFDSFRGNADPNNPVTFSDPSRMGSKKGQYDNTIPLHEMSRTQQLDIAYVSRSVVESLRSVFVDEEGRPKKASEVDKGLLTLADSLGITVGVPGTDLTKSRTTLVREITRAQTDRERAKLEKERREKEIAQIIADTGDTGETTGTGGAPANTFTTAGEQSIQDLLAAASDDGSLPDLSGVSVPSSGSSADLRASGVGSMDAARSYGMSRSSDAFSDRGRFGNKGMLVTRKKQTTKKMKRGGLASKK